VGHDYHLQVKISAVDHNNALVPWDKPGNRLAESIQICKWVEAAGADALHISTGSFFPHPLNPPGDFPIADIADSYDTMISSGRHTLRNYLVFRFPIAWPIGRFLWERKRPGVPEGIIVDDAAEIRRNVSIPVLCTGGFQTASYISKIITDGLCDGVSIARPLIANPNLVQMWADGKDVPDRPCSYCNKCLFHLLEHPLACYDERRFDSREAMLEHVFSVFTPPPFPPG
jgi:2,4-dienoyl-CoA reductase-like NADH-dependent reductase (Old Yellow Enzyme family)